MGVVGHWHGVGAYWHGYHCILCGQHDMQLGVCQRCHRRNVWNKLMKNKVGIALNILAMMIYWLWIWNYGFSMDYTTPSPVEKIVVIFTLTVGNIAEIFKRLLSTNN